MEQRVNFITLGVEDLALMRAFYKEKLRWTPMQDQESIVFFRLNGLVLALYPKKELADDIGISQDGAGFKNFSLSINFRTEAEVDEMYKELVGRGVTGVRAPEKVFWGGYRGYVADPEQNYWELAFNPFLALDQDGNVASPT